MSWLLCHKSHTKEENINKLWFVILYAEENGLNCMANIQNVLKPVKRHSMKRRIKDDNKYIMPLEIGY